jgi:hypothetical protein
MKMEAKHLNQFINFTLVYLVVFGVFMANTSQLVAVK